MSNDPDLLESLSLEDLERVDAACDALAAAWKRGEAPQLEDAVLAAPESLRTVMVAELVRTEIELRVAAGERPVPSEYTSRFPEWSAELHGAITSGLVNTLDATAPTVQFSTKDTAEELRFPALQAATEWVAKPVAGLEESTIRALRSRFEIREVLGRGGMGIVVKARDTKLDRQVALKLLAPEFGRDADAKQRFLREARAAAAVRHDNVVTIYSADEINGVPLLEMELIDGESLAERIKREGALPPAEVTQFAIQIALGLDAAHRRSLIHRDIKPANILLECPDGHASRVKITDFGLARVTAEAAITNSGMIAGTPQYMSPEQAEARPLDHRTDLFSLGSVMYSMCTGQPPFRAESALATLRLVSDRTPPTIRELNPGTPLWLSAIIETLMAKRPEDRFPSAAEVVEALKQASSEFDASVTQELPAAKLVKKRAAWPWIVVCGLVLAAIPIVANRLGKQSTSIDEKQAEPLASNFPSNPDLNTAKHPLESDNYEWSPPENVGAGVNSARPEDHACISADGLQMLFTRFANGQSNLWWSTRPVTTEPFGVAMPLSNEINSPARESDPFLSHDGLSLWFTSNRPDGAGDGDIYVSRRQSTSEPFEPPTSLGPTINTADGESSPFVTADELTLLFGRGAPRKIYLATRPNREAPFGEPKQVASINHGVWQEFPRMTSDGLHLILISSQIQGQQYLWRTSRGSVDADFGPLVPLGPTINQGVMSGPSLSDDGTTLYFSAERPNGFGGRDLWFSRRVPKQPAAKSTALKPDESNDRSPPRAITPFNAEQPKQHQEAWAKRLGTQVEIENSVGMKLKLIPPGEFMMGAPEDDPDAQPQERPQHKVRLTKPFFMGTTEVTVAQFRRFVEATGYVTQAESDAQGAFEVNPKVRQPGLVWNKVTLSEEHPVRCVSWEDARQFCNWLSKTDGRTYRLPTDAEWEYACRAGTTTRYCWGNDFDPAKAKSAINPRDNQVSPVGQYPANPFGLFDMHGNLNEICWDSGRLFTRDEVVDPLGSIEPSDPAVVRGGAMSSSAARLRSSQRYLNDARQFPEAVFATIAKGFRVTALIESTR